MVQVQFDCLAAASAVCDCGQAGPVLGCLCSPCKGKRKVLKKLCVCTGGSTVECLSTCINSRCIKKAPGLADVDPFFFFVCFCFLNSYLHARWLTRTSIVAIKKKKKRFCLATDTVKVLSSWFSRASLKGCQPPGLSSAGVARMAVCEWLTVGGWWWGGSCCPHSDSTKQNGGEKKKKGLPVYLRRLGHPTSQGEERTVPWWVPLFLSSLLFFPTAVCSVRQNKRRQGPGPWSTALWAEWFSPETHIPRRPSEKRGWDWKKKHPERTVNSKEGPKQKNRPRLNFDHLLGTLGPLVCLNASTSVESGCAGMTVARTGVMPLSTQT